MNITAYNPQIRTQKYTIRYRPSYDRVIEGKFTIEDENGMCLDFTENTIYQHIQTLFLDAIGSELISKQPDVLEDLLSCTTMK